MALAHLGTVFHFFPFKPGAKYDLLLPLLNYMYLFKIGTLFSYYFLNRDRGVGGACAPPIF